MLIGVYPKVKTDVEILVDECSYQYFHKSGKMEATQTFITR